MFRIGDFSRLARVTVKTLHHYDETGLLTPSHVDQLTGYRYYTAAQLERLHRILALKDLGFALEDIRDLLDPACDAAELQRRLVARRAELTQQLHDQQLRLRRLDALQDSLQRATAIESNAPAVVLREAPPIEVHSQRKRVASFGTAVQEMFETAEATVAQARMRADASPFLILHDSDYREVDADVEACIPVKPGANARIATRIVAGGSVGCVTYRGAYDQTPLLYAAMLQWMECSGLRLAGPLREIYHRYGADQSGYRLPAHVLAATSADFVTELQAPVAPLIDR